LAPGLVEGMFGTPPVNILFNGFRIRIMPQRYVLLTYERTDPPNCSILMDGTELDINPPRDFQLPRVDNGFPTNSSNSRSSFHKARQIYIFEGSSNWVGVLPPRQMTNNLTEIVYLISPNLTTSPLRYRRCSKLFWGDLVFKHR
jgi:hypothetical protein